MPTILFVILILKVCCCFEKIVLHICTSLHYLVFGWVKFHSVILLIRLLSNDVFLMSNQHQFCCSDVEMASFDKQCLLRSIGVEEDEQWLWDLLPWKLVNVLSQGMATVYIETPQLGQSCLHVKCIIFKAHMLNNHYYLDIDDVQILGWISPVKSTISCVEQL